LAAISDTVCKGNFQGKNPVEVTFLVNGQEMPFTATLEDIWRRMEAEMDGKVLAKAEEMVTAAGLDAVSEVLREVEWKVKEALSKVKLDN
jgi:hypothetical protein